MKSYITKPEKWYKIVNDKPLREWLENVSHFGRIDNGVLSLELRKNGNIHVYSKHKNSIDINLDTGMVLQDSEVFVYQFVDGNVLNEKVITFSEFHSEFTILESVI